MTKKKQWIKILKSANLLEIRPQISFIRNFDVFALKL